jgi:hypothetical protein
VTLSVERKLTNQDAFDIAVLHLLNQGNGSFSASGKARHRGPRGKSAVGALVSDRLYTVTMEGKTIHQVLAGSSAEYESVRERLGGVTPSLLNDLQALHDRIGSCLPSLFRHLVLADGYRIAQAFGLSVRMVHLWVAYQRIRGPWIPRSAAEPSESQAMKPAALERPSEELKLVA